MIKKFSVYLDIQSIINEEDTSDALRKIRAKVNSVLEIMDAKTFSMVIKEVKDEHLLGDQIIRKRSYSLEE